VRLLAPLSSLPRTKLPPGPRFLRPLLLREPNMLEGPKDGGWLVLLVLLRRRRSSLPTLLDAKSGGGAWFLKSPEKLRASPRPKGGRPPLLACWRRRSISASCCWRIAWKNELECLCHKIGNTTARVKGLASSRISLIFLGPLSASLDAQLAARKSTMS